MRPPTKAVSLLMAAATACGILAVPANAAPAGNIVTVGDSFTANPDQWRNFTRGFNPQATVGYPQREGCLQAPNNWARKLAAKGFSVSDWSCTAQTSQTALGRLDRAIATGDIHRGTRAVVLPHGMNNYGPFGAFDGVNIIKPAEVRSGYLADIRTATSKIRLIAPNAQIIIPGSLSVADPTTTVYCAVNVVPNFPAGIPIPILRDVENWNRDNQQDAAAVNRATFIDIKAGSATHHSCAPDNQRWVAGIIDTTTVNYNMAFHPSDAGSQFIADSVAAVL